MRITYNKVKEDCIFPINRREVLEIVGLIDREIIKKISTINFCYNSKTTQEGSMKRIGEKYELKVNFCLKDCKSPVLQNKNKKYLGEIKRYGGEIDKKGKEIHWKLSNAKLYAAFILLHEIGHVVFYEKFLGIDTDYGATVKEEDWCDNFSQNIVKKLKKENLIKGS